MSGIKSYGTVALIDEVEVKRPAWRKPHTMDPRTWLRDLTPYFLYTLFIATLGPLLFGYHLAELNTPQKVITCEAKSIRGSDNITSRLPQCIPMNPTEIGLVSSIFTVGGLFGALAAGPLSAKQGRIKTMLFTTIFFTIGPIFEALAPSIAVLSFGRLISGFGAGASVVVVPLYISEISPPAERGFFGAFTQVMVNGGIFITQLLGFFLSYNSMWRLVLAIGGAIGLANAVGLFTISESPRWLAENGHVSKARDVLQGIRGKKFDVEEEINSWGHFDQGEDEGEGAGLLNQNDGGSGDSTKAKTEHLSMLQVFAHADHRKAVIAVIFVMMAQQFTGINSIIMYGVDLLADLLKANSALLNLAVSALNIIVTVSCAPLTDKFGRKTCLLASIIGMGTSSFVLGFAIKNSISVLSGIAVLFFVGSFAVGLGPIPFILASELVPAEAVSSTQTWALCANWISTFCVAQFFPILNTALGKGMAYFLFAGLAAFFATFVKFFVPETKGKRNADEVWGRTGARLD